MDSPRRGLSHILAKSATNSYRVEVHDEDGVLITPRIRVKIPSRKDVPRRHRGHGERCFRKYEYRSRPNGFLTGCSLVRLLRDLCVSVVNLFLFRARPKSIAFGLPPRLSRIKLSPASSSSKEQRNFATSTHRQLEAMCEPQLPVSVKFDWPTVLPPRTSCLRGGPACRPPELFADDRARFLASCATRRGSGPAPRYNFNRMLYGSSRNVRPANRTAADASSKFNNASSPLSNTLQYTVSGFSISNACFTPG